MAVIHKYQEHDFENGFQTHNSILDILPYEPEVIFIGTFNHGWSWNESDFFYGRGMYMWTALGNIFLYNNNHFSKARNHNHNSPTFEQLFKICSKGKICFADIVKGVRKDISAIENPLKKSVHVNNEYTWESYKDGPLDYMGQKDWLDDNVEAIVQYINKTKSIKHIYFTFKSGNWLFDKLNDIRENVRNDVSAHSIFTPTANGFGKNLQEPFNNRAWGLTHCWVWNGLDHDIQIKRPDYGHLDHNWLKNKGIDPNNF